MLSFMLFPDGAQLFNIYSVLETNIYTGQVAFFGIFSYKVSVYAQSIAL